MTDPEDRFCAAVSPDAQPCNFPATVHCNKCNKWFCDEHAENEECHACMLAPGDEGGEA